MGYTACLDANVLHPWVVCDLLLRLAENGLFRPLWSERILAETVGSIRERRPDLTEEQLSRRVAEMTRQFPEAMAPDATPYERSVPPAVDPGDRHVVATAMAGEADVIVTSNLADIPASALESLGILVQHPDEFLVHQWWLDPSVVAAELIAMAAATERPPLSPDEILDRLARIAPEFVRLVRESDDFTELLVT